MEHALRIVKCPWEWLSREPGAAAGAGKALLLKWSKKCEQGMEGIGPR